ncbi:MAG TPA: hypothetical protein VFL84_14325 [Gammaproteobacteria bacterium]|nr:hypothetical protein [Gammaproteobacteria bacterium]
MRYRTALAVAGLAIAIAPLCAHAQKKPRTAWGDPDITGAYSEFTTAPLERDPKYAEKEFLAREEYEAFAKARLETRFGDDDTEIGTQADVHYSMGQFQLSENEGVHSLNLRTSIVTQPKNGRIPPLTAEAEARRDARAAARRGKEFDGPEMRSLTERCIIWSSTQAPILPRGYNSNLQIFQSPGYVIIQGEMGDPRVIPTDGRKLPDKLLPQWNGTSVGRFEGDTFVVETAGFHPESAWRNASENMHVTERITRVDDDTLEYAFTVVDPDTWAEPWGGVYPLTKLDGLLYEYACTEGNYGMANILSGARAGEKATAAK